MKCSMMYKRGLSAFLALWLCTLLSAPAFAAEEPADWPEQPGSILLIYDKNADKDALTHIEQILSMGTAVSRVMDVGTTEECKERMGEYEFIICYDIHQADVSLLRALDRSGAQLMILGGEVLERLLRFRGKGKVCTGEEAENMGRMSYTFPDGGEYETLVGWEAFPMLAETEYESGVITAGSRQYPFCTRVEGIQFIPVTDLSTELTRAALMQEIVTWMWPYNDAPPSYAQFLVLDNVYPFMPAQKLQEIVDAMLEKETPFVISVMPLEHNGEFPAMTQFCQVLAYAQANGASVILSAPIIHKDVQDAEELYEKLTAMTMPYIQNGVYPLGIQVPESWTYEEPYRELLKRYSTVFVYDDGKSTGFRPAEHTSLFCRQGHKVVYPRMALDDTGVSRMQCYSSATYVDCTTEPERLAQYADNARRSNNPFMDLREYNHSVWLNDTSLVYSERVLYLNGEITALRYEPAEYDENFDFQRDALKKISVDLQNQNQTLIVIVVALIIVFGVLILLARRQMRKIFFNYKRTK